VHVRATVSDSRSVLHEVEKGQAILGLVGQKVDSPSLVVRPLGTDCLVLVVPPRHPWARRKAVSLRALRRESLIIRELGSGSRYALEKSLERAGTSISALNVTLELGSNAAIKDAVRRGLGLAFLSLLAVQKDIDAAELCRVEVKGLDLTRHFYLVHDRCRPLSPAASIFLHFLESHPLGSEGR
jgi:LysR family transcriptional regulator, low CO2-responsive transcriptional regulator